MVRKKFANILCISGLILLATGCGKTSEVTEGKVDTYTLHAEKTQEAENYRDLLEWKGVWESFTSYCEDKELDNTWKRISDEVDIEVEQLKDTFSQICFVADDVKHFEVDGNTIAGFDSDKNEIFKNEYVLIDRYEQDSEETVIEGEVSYLFQSKKEAGRYSYICLMPICSMEKGDGMEMLKHFHFNYGSTIEEATNRSGIPTMVEGGAEDLEKAETLQTFFLGTK